MARKCAPDWRKAKGRQGEIHEPSRVYLIAGAAARLSDICRLPSKLPPRPVSVWRGPYFGCRLRVALQRGLPCVHSSTHLNIGRVAGRRNQTCWELVCFMFHRESRLVLTRENPIGRKIQNSVLARFLVGYPSRKPHDTFIRDAISWEWMLESARRIFDRVVEVSFSTEQSRHPSLGWGCDAESM